MQLEDWLDDLCVRFIINLPPEELRSVERICFQVEEAQWFYEDFIRPLDPSLPSLTLRAFSLRIFQHCPLFSQWSAEFHTTAFAEFIAYKSRVPVRGAILLNDAMDEVVLVKGWKKSANWSFPRGKINKDENDLDCAVREVYEETGFDAREAGLVKDEKDMKYIEVTMREQHMRLYVFRGVPKDTEFEAKTRKEISKIEWYKLTDLPTLKKNRQHEGSGTDHTPINANKFYMVAPFLNPLKKWIIQQRKRENRYSSHLAAPPMVAEDATTEEEQDTLVMGNSLAGPHSLAVSDLPEVSAPAVDPTAHLKELLSIGTQPLQPQAVHAPSVMPQVDAEKSNALLSLLRGKPQGQSGSVPRTPLDQVSMPSEAQRSPLVSHVRQPQVDQARPPPVFQPTLNQVSSSIQPFFQRPQEIPTVSNTTVHPGQSTSQIAPYLRTGDPLSWPQGAMQQAKAAVPPASALPKLTNHTKALLDVFKGSAGTPTPTPAISAVGTALPNTVTGADFLRRLEPQTQTPTDNLGVTSQINHDSTRACAPLNSNTSLRLAGSTGSEGRGSTSLSSVQPQNAQRASLLDLFNQPSTPKTVSPTALPPAPVELAATTTSVPPEKPQAKEDDLLLALLQQGSKEVSRKVGETKRPAPREGETSATINGPLNQPEFDVITRTKKHATNEMGRNPLTTNRTLFDPNAPTPIKILTRSEEPRPQPLQAPRSPRGLKPASKRPVRDKVVPKEQPKPFQPQILRRPQTAERGAVTGLPHPNEATSQRMISTAAAPAPLVPDIDIGEKLIPSRKPSHTDAQKQTLLSLFGGGLDTTPRATANPGSGVVSPLSASQVMSPSGEGPISGLEPISTRTSRVGSMTSIRSGTGTGRAVGDKRQTGAENKAFLLGYLGRIATQDK